MMNDEILLYINDFCKNSHLNCEECNKLSKCPLKAFINYIKANGIEDFSSKLRNNNLDESISNIYNDTEKMYYILGKETLPSICGLHKDNHY